MSFLSSIPDEFHRYFSSWVRFEPRSRNNDFSRGLEARIADPLWMLARQWQIGEFKAEDAGSPARLKMEYKTLPVSQAAAGEAGEFSPVDGSPESHKPPLEVLVEQESIFNFNENMRMDYRTRVKIGQEFERILREQLPAAAEPLICILRKPAYFALTEPAPEVDQFTDKATADFLKLVCGRVIDGGKLLAAFKAGSLPALPPELGIEQQVLIDMLTLLEEYYSRIFSGSSPVGSTWEKTTLDYKFRIKAADGDGSEVVLKAPGYKNGELDWYTFDVEDCVFTDTDLQTLNVNPVRIGFAGKPNERWWTFEDYNVDFGGLDASTTDLARLLLMEFSLIFADDWNMIPWTLPIGSVSKVASMTVTNVFGEHVQLQPARDIDVDPLKHWELYGFKNPVVPKANLLYIPSALHFKEESKPLEEIRFIRDEGANLVWAVEHTVTNGIGKPVNGFDLQIERNPPPPQTPATNVEKIISPFPAYKLASTVPDNWIPYVPVNAELSGLPGVQDNFSIRLRMANMLRNTDADAPEPITPFGLLLNPIDPGKSLEWINEESVPRTGVKLQLTKQRVRWTDGTTYVWVGRKTAAGRGEGSSGLRFDFLKERP